MRTSSADSIENVFCHGCMLRRIGVEFIRIPWIRLKSSRGRHKIILHLFVHRLHARSTQRPVWPRARDLCSHAPGGSRMHKTQKHLASILLTAALTAPFGAALVVAQPASAAAQEERARRILGLAPRPSRLISVAVATQASANISSKTETAGRKSGQPFFYSQLKLILQERRRLPQEQPQRIM